MKNILFIGAIVAGVLWYIAPSKKVVEQTTEIKVTADKIKEYVSISGARQNIRVVYDTSYTTVSYKVDFSVLGKKIQYGEEYQAHKLTDTRTYRVTAGVDGSIQFTVQRDTVWLQLPEAKVLHIEELNELYEVSESGTWKASDFAEASMRSKNVATETAMQQKLRTVAFANVANFLARQLQPATVYVNGQLADATNGQSAFLELPEAVAGK